jgi:hypothetical protein
MTVLVDENSAKLLAARDCEGDLDNMKVTSTLQLPSVARAVCVGPASGLGVQSVELNRRIRIKTISDWPKKVSRISRGNTAISSSINNHPHVSLNNYVYTHL